MLSERAILFLFPNRNILFIKDVLVKSLEKLISVIPAKAGIKLSPLTLPLSPANGGEGGGEGEQ